MSSMFKNKNQTVLEAIADSIADPQTLLHLRFSICAPKPGQTAKISRNPLSDKPKRTQMSPNESKRAQTSPNEPKRTQTNPNEPKRTQTNCKFDFRFDTLFRFAPGCAKLRPSSTFLRSSCTPQIGRNMSECYVSDVETGQNWKSSVEIGNPAWVKLLHPKPTTNRSEFSNFRPLYVIRALKKATSLTRQRCRYLGGQHTEQSGHVWSIIYNHGEKNHST
jgi:hypothetical protein